MKNKAIIAALIALGVILAVFAGIYFVKQSKSPIDSPQQSQNSAPESSVLENATPGQTTAGNLKSAENGAGMNNLSVTKLPQTKIITDDFSIALPSGWKQAEPVVGTSAMAVNISENVSDPAAKKINFKSYFAVSYDTLQGKGIIDYLQTVKNSLSQAVPNIVFTKDQDLTINGIFAHATEAEMSQQGVDFKVLMIVVSGQGEDVWVVSFNTVKSSWDSYKDMFYGVADSFIVKK